MQPNLLGLPDESLGEKLHLPYLLCILNISYIKYMDALFAKRGVG